MLIRTGVYVRSGYLVRGVVQGQLGHGIASPVRHVSVALVVLEGLHHRGKGPGRTERILHPTHTTRTQQQQHQTHGREMETSK